MKTKTAATLIVMLFATKILLAQKTDTGSNADNVLKELQGSMTFQVWQYDSCKIKQRHTIPVVNSKTGVLQIANSTWKCDVVGSPVNKDGSVVVEATFKVAKGRMASSGAAITFDFAGWSTNNYVMIPAVVYNGNRFRVIPGGYMPVYPADMYYNKNSPLALSDNPRLALKAGEQSRMELSTSSAATPAMTFFSPSKKRGFVVLTEQRTTLGNSGIIIEENADRTHASFSLTAPVVREKIAGFGGFFKSDDNAPTWNEGDEVTIRFSVHSFPVNDIPSFLLRFMDLRKSFTGKNHPRNLTPMSAIFDFTRFQTDHYRWNDMYGCYVPETPWDGFGYKRVFQIGWVGGMMNTYPMAYSNDSIHLARVSKTFDFVVNSMQGTSGYFYGIYGSDTVQAELKRAIPKEIVKQHPNVKLAMVRKNADVLLWLIKQFMLLREQGNGSFIRTNWETAARNLARAFVNTWNNNGELGQYVDPRNGEIAIFNSTAAAIVPAGLALASKYFHDPEFLKAAVDITNYYYSGDVVKLGLTSGFSGDISQDPDADSAYGLLESLMALYWATSDPSWLVRAEVVAALGATWTLSYDFAFPSNSDLGKLQVHAAGAVWASAQNKHAAPGICTASGDYLFKLYRATGKRKYAELLRDIQHAHTEVVETPGRPTISIGRGDSWSNENRVNYYGCSMERIQITDSEGKNGTGRLARNTSNGWTELNGMLMAMEIPGVYLQLDKNEMYVFDHVEVKILERSNHGIRLKITNPTKFDARVSVFAETSADAKKPLDYLGFLKWQKVIVRAGESCKVKLNSKGTLERM
jgi:hypothetical protein